MSTTFTVTVRGKEIPVAMTFCKGRGKVGVDWMNPIAPSLPRDRRVHPLSNSAQGVKTIGDLIAIENAAAVREIQVSQINPETGETELITYREVK